VPPKAAAKKSPAKKTLAPKSAKKPPAKELAAKKPARPVADESDPRFAPVARALARIPGFSLMASKSGGLQGMMLAGKSFGMASHGRFILKLTEERAAELIAGGVAKPFQHGPRVMTSWVEVIDPKADWVALAKEAASLASVAPRKKRAKR
jgi:hypothetical protein